MSSNLCNAETETQLLTAGDVAKRLSISLSMAYRLMQNGSIIAVHIGRSVRVREAELEAFIEIQEVKNLEVFR